MADRGSIQLNLNILFNRVFTCGGLARRSISAPCFLLLQRMDFFVSSTNISFSVRLAHPTQLAHLAHPAQPVMGIRFHGYLDIRDILRGRYQISWIIGYRGYPKRKLIDVMGIRFHGYSDIMDFLGEIMSM